MSWACRMLLMLITGVLCGCALSDAAEIGFDLGVTAQLDREHDPRQRSSAGPETDCDRFGRWRPVRLRHDQYELDAGIALARIHETRAAHPLRRFITLLASVGPP